MIDGVDWGCAVGEPSPGVECCLSGEVGWDVGMSSGDGVGGEAAVLKGWGRDLRFQISTVRSIRWKKVVWVWKCRGLAPDEGGTRFYFRTLFSVCLMAGRRRKGGWV